MSVRDLQIPESLLAALRRAGVTRVTVGDDGRVQTVPERLPRRLRVALCRHRDALAGLAGGDAGALPRGWDSEREGV